MEFIDLLTNVGFPIACCYVMYKYTVNTTAKYDERIDALNKQIIEITEKSIKAIENNSSILNDLKDIFQNRSYPEACNASERGIAQYDIRQEDSKQ